MSMEFHHTWGPEEDAIALRMRTEGRSFREIADELGCSASSVRTRLRKLGARRRRDAKR